ADKNLNVLDNLPANEEELAPKEVLPDGLVDPLPFLNAGLWEKVHIASLVPKEKTELPEEPKIQPGMGMAGGMRGGSAMMGMGSGMAGQQRMMQMQSQMGSMGGSGMGMMGGASGGMRAGMGMGMGGYGSSESVGNFWKSEEKRVMIRAL